VIFKFGFEVKLMFACWPLEVVRSLAVFEEDLVS